MKALFAHMDANSDGRVSFKELDETLKLRHARTTLLEKPSVRWTRRARARARARKRMEGLDPAHQLQMLQRSAHGVVVYGEEPTQVELFEGLPTSGKLAVLRQAGGGYMAAQIQAELLQASPFCLQGVRLGLDPNPNSQPYSLTSTLFLLQGVLPGFVSEIVLLMSRDERAALMVALQERTKQGRRSPLMSLPEDLRIDVLTALDTDDRRRMLELLLELERGVILEALVRELGPREGPLGPVQPQAGTEAMWAVRGLLEELAVAGQEWRPRNPERIVSILGWNSMLELRLKKAPFEGERAQKHVVDMLSTQPLREAISLKPRVPVKGEPKQAAPGPGMSPMAWLQAGDWRVGAGAAGSAEQRNWRLRRHAKPARTYPTRTQLRKEIATGGSEEPPKPSTAYRKVGSRRGRRYHVMPSEGPRRDGFEAPPAIESHLKQLWSENVGGLLTPRRQYDKMERKRRAEAHHSNAGHHVQVLPPDPDPAGIVLPAAPPHLAEKRARTERERQQWDARMAATEVLRRLLSPNPDANPNAGPNGDPSSNPNGNPKVLERLGRIEEELEPVEEVPAPVRSATHLGHRGGDEPDAAPQTGLLLGSCDTQPPPPKHRLQAS